MSHITDSIFVGLNEAQTTAVAAGPEPLLIIAGAGTGKTTVITRRIANLILEEIVKPDEVLALTFTDKAAGEMQERIEQLLPIGYVDLWVSTFHAFCERILRNHAIDVGLLHDFRLLSQNEQIVLLRSHIDELELEYYRPKGNPTKFVSALISHFSRLKDEDITPEQYLAYAQQVQLTSDAAEGIAPKSQLSFAMPKTPEERAELAQEAARVGEVARAYQLYQQLLRDAGALDFGDLIVEVIHLFKERPHILKKYQEQFRYVVVDEFQDTNIAQYDLVKLLAAPQNSITVVADDDQSIYSFRGAAMSNILLFKKEFSEAVEVSLTENYRSTQPILDLAYNFIQHNNPNRLETTLSINKKLIGHNESETAIEHLHSESLEGEAHLVMQKILEIKKAEPDLPWSEIAILVRANDHADTIIPYLDRAEIPYQFLAFQGLFVKPLVLDIIASLKLIENYHDSRAFYRFLNMPVWNVSHQDIMLLLEHTRKKTVSLYQAARDVAAVDGVSEGVVKALEAALQLLDGLVLDAKTQTAGQVLLQFLERSGYLKHITAHDQQEAEEQTLYLKQFYDYVVQFEKGAFDKSIHNFLFELQMIIDSGDFGRLQGGSEASPDAVKIMTVHASKGLEFEHVFIMNLVDKRFPSIRKSDPIQVPEALIRDVIPSGDHHLEEERRLFYVALTRARRGLYLTSGENYGGARKKKPSRFLIESGFAETVPRPTGDVLFGVEAVTGHDMKPSELQRLLPHTFSFSQLQAYDNCPWQYRFAFLLGVPIPGKPSASFGRSVHAALYEFFRRGRERTENPQGELFDVAAGEGKAAATFPSKAELLQLYDEYWIDEWYESMRQKEEYYTKGKQALEAFYDLHAGNWPQIEELEQRFTMVMPEVDVKMKGAIDRVDVVGVSADDPEKRAVKVLDYKTGKVDMKKDPKQLYLYAMALQEVFGVEVRELSYYFIEENVELVLPLDQKKMDSTREWVLSMIAKIQDGNFAPTPGFQCKFCDFKDICEYRA